MGSQKAVNAHDSAGGRAAGGEPLPTAIAHGLLPSVSAGGRAPGGVTPVLRAAAQGKLREGSGSGFRVKGPHRGEMPRCRENSSPPLLRRGLGGGGVRDKSRRSTTPSPPPYQGGESPGAEIGRYSQPVVSRPPAE
jgi:hypothetical protein